MSELIYRGKRITELRTENAEGWEHEAETGYGGNAELKSRVAELEKEMEELLQNHFTRPRNGQEKMILLITVHLTLIRLQATDFLERGAEKLLVMR